MGDKKDGPLFGINASESLWSGPAEPLTEERLRAGLDRLAEVLKRPPPEPRIFFTPAEYRRFKADCEALGIAHHYRWMDEEGRGDG